MNEELNTKILNIDATLKQEKTAREQSEFASKTYHQQIQARGHLVENNLKEKDNRIMELEKRLLEKESELDHVESDKLTMNDRSIELLKSKMDAAMKTNKRLLDNATNTINEHMEMNIKLVKDKETLSITIENLKRSLKALKMRPSI